MANWTNDPDDSDRHLIVLSAPHQRHPKYRRHFEAIIDFDIRLARTIMGHDNVIVLARPQEMPFLRGALPDDVLLPADVSDIWIRDFAPVLTTKMVQFVYRPRYLKKWEADEARESFARFCRRYGLAFEKSRLVLDGGNLVSNHKNMAVVTERVLSDNPGWSREEIVAELKDKLALDHVAIIPEEPGDVTGHADGMVMWIPDKILALSDYPPPFGARLRNTLEDALPDVTLVPVTCGVPLPRDAWRRKCPSAFGLNVNAIVTAKSVYAPVFGVGSDGGFVKAVSNRTDRPILLVHASPVADLGGSVRCLSWQSASASGARLLTLARDSELRRKVL